MKRSRSFGEVRESSDVRKDVTALRAMKPERIFGKMVIYRGFWIGFCRLGLQCSSQLSREFWGGRPKNGSSNSVWGVDLCDVHRDSGEVVLLVSWWWGVVVKAMVLVVPTTATGGSDCLVMVTD
ncbi:clathrin assembly At2g25430 [Olea europaea subsp. europaea]|uniref:Clathrin assembly At2g25430 n=1 Tax=Olea europaea subsp. europaea TaxID=158383 RepID=A0A8S0Q4K8_OLEEU|nr:clathrin assembly At2g25430 [Olea europaea subsp. europaea]